LNNSLCEDWSLHCYLTTPSAKTDPFPRDRTVDPSCEHRGRSGKQARITVPVWDLYLIVGFMAKSFVYPSIPRIYISCESLQQNRASRIRRRCSRVRMRTEGCLAKPLTYEFMGIINVADPRKCTPGEGRPTSTCTWARHVRMTSNQTSTTSIFKIDNRNNIKP
jgi:hypothetical protein